MMAKHLLTIVGLIFKNLFIVILLFLSIGLMTEENYSCDLVKDCYRVGSSGQCFNSGQKDVHKIRIDETWFSKKFFVDGDLLNEESEPFSWITTITKTVILSTTAKSPHRQSSSQWIFDRDSRTLKFINKSNDEEKIVLRSEFNCKKVS